MANRPLFREPTPEQLDDRHDPFMHHPELRAKIRDPLTSWARSFMPSDLDERLASQGAEGHQTRKPGSWPS